VEADRACRSEEAFRSTPATPAMNLARQGGRPDGNHRRLHRLPGLLSGLNARHAPTRDRYEN
jgi:hypothetical protein